MRYFFISFVHDIGSGNITLQLETYPSFQGIIQTLKEQDPNLENITILSIQELSEKDFKDFTE